MVERVFTSSTSLNSEAVQHFVTHLCEVSKLEVPHAISQYYTELPVS